MRRGPSDPESPDTIYSMWLLTRTIGRVGDGDYLWPFDKPHFLLLNVAVEPGRAGAIAADFTEAEMIVDYVKITDNNGNELLNDEFGGKFCEIKQSEYDNLGCCGDSTIAG